jgi:redox-sensitive bicupin YhaK (pirin superfamily)
MKMGKNDVKEARVILPDGKSFQIEIGDLRRRWVFWVKGRKVVSEGEGEVKVIAYFREPVSMDEAKRILGLI